MEKEPKTEVVFRVAPKYGVEAWFPHLHGGGFGVVTVYAHIGQHGAGHRDGYNRTRPVRTAAERQECAELAAELRAIGYTLKERKRWPSNWRADSRNCPCNRNA